MRIVRSHQFATGSGCEEDDELDFRLQPLLYIAFSDFFPLFFLLFKRAGGTGSSGGREGLIERRSEAPPPSTEPDPQSPFDEMTNWIMDRDRT